MSNKTVDENKEKAAYEKHMLEEGYIKFNDKWILSKYPQKDPSSYKEALPGKS